MRRTRRASLSHAPGRWRPRSAALCAARPSSAAAGTSTAASTGGSCRRLWTGSCPRCGRAAWGRAGKPVRTRWDWGRLARGPHSGSHLASSGHPASPAGGGRPQGRPLGAGGAIRARARAALLVPVLRLRGAHTPQPREPDGAARGAAGAPGQVRSGRGPPRACPPAHVGGGSDPGDGWPPLEVASPRLGGKRARAAGSQRCGGLAGKASRAASSKSPPVTHLLRFSHCYLRMETGHLEDVTISLPALPDVSWHYLPSAWLISEQ